MSGARRKRVAQTFRISLNGSAGTNAKLILKECCGFGWNA